MDDLRVDTSELDPRVDQLFASAMEQQLEEQRTLTLLASRVETALRDLQRSTEGLSARPNGAEPAAPNGTYTRDAVLQTLERLRLETGQQRSELRKGLERIGEQFDLADLRGELAELAARVEHGAAPLSTALDGIHATLRDLVARAEGDAEPLADPLEGLGSWLTSFADQIDARVASGHEEAARAVTSAQRALAEQAVRLEAVREAMQTQAGHAGDRVAALLDHATANQREVLATLGSAAAHLAAATTAARETAKDEAEQLRACIADAVAVAKAELDQSVGAAQALCEQLASSSSDSRDIADRTRVLLEELTARIDDAQAQGARHLSQAATALEQTLGNLEPSIVAAVEDVRQALLDTAAASGAQSESTVATLRGVAAGTVDELRGMVEDVAQRMMDAQAGATVELSRAASEIVRAAEDMQPVFSSGLGKVYGAVAAATTQVRASSEVAAADTLSALADVLQGIEATISARLAEYQASAAEERARTEQAAAAIRADSDALVEAAADVARTASALTPAVATALAQVDGTVNEAVTLVESALGERLAQSEAAAQAAAGDLQSAVSEAQDRLRVWLAGTLPDAVAQVTSGLSEQLERAEARVDETANRMEALLDQAGGGLHSATEDARARMVEAARALTAVAGESVGPGERRLAALTDQIDALMARLHTWEGPLPQDGVGGLAVSDDGFPPGTTERDTLALDLERVVARGEELERRLSRTVEDVVHRLDEAATGLVRLESQLVGYLRERDRMLVVERENLVADLADRLGPVAAKKEGGRLLGGLLTNPSRRREPDAPSTGRQQPPRGPQQAVRPSGLSSATNPGVLVSGLLPPESGARRAAPALPACEVCGFVAKSPGGLAAHRRTHD